VSHPVEVTGAVLAELAPPEPDGDANKHDRGTAVVVGGSCETPGAVLLAGVAALRAGAGRLRPVVDESCVAPLGVAVPEARVSPIDGDVPDGDAVLIGPGLLDDRDVEPIVDAVTTRRDVVVVLDARAVAIARRHPDWIRRLDGRALLVPNPNELEDLGVEDVRSAAEHFGAVVAARGPETWIATPDGEMYVDRHGTAGLATSGTGDVASGLALGLVARGASPLGAAVWAAALHGRAGERLGGAGFLARQLLDEISAAWRDLAS